MEEGDPLVANMGHELRNPLTSILALAEAMHEGIYGPLSEGQRRALQSIRECVAREIDLITDVIDLSRVLPVQPPLARAACRLEEQADKALSMVRELGRNRAIQLSSQVQLRSDGVQADARRFRQMTVHLLMAVLLATPAEGQVRLSLGDVQGGLLLQVAGAPGGVAVELPVRHEDEENVLETVAQGRPLGFRLLRRLVDQHGGTLAGRRLAGGGICLSLHLPQGGAATVEAKAQPVARPEGTKDTPLILLADDQAELVAIVSDYLRHKGFRVATASNGREACELAERLRPELVIMDVQMPGMDGIEAIQHLRQCADATVAQVPVMALSGLGGAGDRDRCLAAGANSYLVKPFGVKELEEAARGLVRQPS